MRSTKERKRSTIGYWAMATGDWLHPSRRQSQSSGDNASGRAESSGGGARNIWQAISDTLSRSAAQ